MNSPTFAIIALLAALVALTKILADNRTRRRALELRASEDLIRELGVLVRNDASASSLKWGLLAIGTGLGLLVVSYLPDRFPNPLGYGVILMFAGGSLLLHHALTRGRGPK